MDIISSFELNHHLKAYIFNITVQVLSSKSNKSNNNQLTDDVIRENPVKEIVKITKFKQSLIKANRLNPSKPKITKRTSIITIKAKPKAK